MKGIILAGGKGTRLYPITKGLSKQLLPVYDKPMVYYPLSVLMLAGIKEILIITTPKHLKLYKNLLKDGSQLGCAFAYKTQDKPRGIADAFILGEEFIGDDKVALILGDNIFYGTDLKNKLESSITPNGGRIFAYQVSNPKRYGIVEFDNDKNVISLEEKPDEPKSNYAVPGLYFYDNNVVEIAKNMEPSERGELEITDVNKTYLSRNKLKVTTFGRGTAWLDTGTHDSLIDASNFVRAIEKRQGLKIGCIEEIAYRNDFINLNKLNILSKKYKKSGYGEYLKSLIEEKKR